jgi:predicted alpha-1,2-mannosidase
MVNHRATAVALFLLFALPQPGFGAEVGEKVDPFIGTGGHGHTFPGAAYPFGMVQLSPDTRLTGWDGCSGYHYSDSLVYGFSHTHLSGTGCSDYGDILIMPAAGPHPCHQGDGAPRSDFPCRFSHRSEYASPGYYRVRLPDEDILAELTVTRRCGFHRYSFPAGRPAEILVDLAHRDRVIEAGLSINGDSEIAGFRRSRAWAKDQHVYFVAQFSQPFSSFGIELNDERLENTRQATGGNLKAFLEFQDPGGKPVMVRVGISAVSVEGARKNLEAEILDWNFEAVKAAAGAAWEKALGLITVRGGTPEQQTTFYTALYHTMIAPNLYTDVDGRYRGRDQHIHTAEGYEHYTVFSLWDTYRAAHPLYTLIEPERTVDFIKTFLSQYEQGGRLPVWELAANETDCMIGYHAVPVIVDAYIKGIRGFDAEKAYEAMKHSAGLDLAGLDDYREHGYIPAGMEGESVSKTLEYAYDDWCIAVGP